MKKIFYVFLGVIAFACTQTEKKNIEETNAGYQQADTAEYALALDSAVRYIKRYDSIAKAALKIPAPVKAYTVRAADLLEALGLPKKTKVKYSHVRAYIGMDLNNHFRLFFTPVDGASIHEKKPGKDVILNGPHTHGLNEAIAKGIQTDPVQDGSYVLDFTAPCPNTCATDSPLNQ